MISQETSEPSVALVDLITKDLPAVLLETRSCPGAVEFAVWLDRIIREFAVTAVVLTVARPLARVVTPALALVPSLILSPRPAVAISRSQLVNSMTLAACRSRTQS